MEVGTKQAFDVDALIDQALNAKLLDELTIKLICLKARDLLIKESNVVTVSPPK